MFGLRRLGSGWVKKQKKDMTAAEYCLLLGGLTKTSQVVNIYLIISGSFTCNCAVSKFQRNSTCCVLCYRRCSWSLSTFRVSSYSVSTACATQLCARSGSRPFPGYHYHRPLPPALAPTDAVRRQQRSALGTWVEGYSPKRLKHK